MYRCSLSVHATLSGVLIQLTFKEEEIIQRFDELKLCGKLKFDYFIINSGCRKSGQQACCCTGIHHQIFTAGIGESFSTSTT